MSHDFRQKDRRCFHPGGPEFGGRRGRGFGRHGGGHGGDHGGGHEGHHHGRAHGRGHGRGRRRVFDAGELRLVLLKLIAEEDRHGYDLIRAIEALSGGSYAPSPGVVYPALSVMGDMDLIRPSEADGARKAFAITEAGSASLAENAEMVETLFARLTVLAEEREHVDAAPIRRAMDNLRTVLRTRLGNEDADKDMVHAVAGILDEATQRIERL